MSKEITYVSRALEEHDQLLLSELCMIVPAVRSSRVSKHIWNSFPKGQMGTSACSHLTGYDKCIVPNSWECTYLWGVVLAALAGGHSIYGCHRDQEAQLLILVNFGQKHINFSTFLIKAPIILGSVFKKSSYENSPFFESWRKDAFCSALHSSELSDWKT